MKVMVGGDGDDITHGNENDENDDDDDDDDGRW